MISKTWQFFKSSPIFSQISHWKFKIENKIIMGGWKEDIITYHAWKNSLDLYLLPIDLPRFVGIELMNKIFIFWSVSFHYFWRECDNMYLGRTTNFLSNDSGVDDVLSPPASVRNTHSLIRFEINWWFWQY